jgi:hypothetical protein
MTQETIQRELLAGTDRRRIPRYSCIGQAKIASLPMSGSLLMGKVRNLGMGGCSIECIETAYPFDLGARAEILVEVNSWFFRAIGHVRSVRSSSGISVEFMHMSAGGYSVLAELIAGLERPRGVTSRQTSLIEHSRGLLRGKSSVQSGIRPAPKDSVAIVGTVVPPQSADMVPAAHRGIWVRDLYPGANSLDIFG